jgi:hypothetical protein
VTGTSDAKHARRRRSVVLVSAAIVANGAVAAALAAAGSRGSVAAPPKPASWDEFPVFVWFAGGPKPGAESFSVLAKHGLGGCNVEGSDASDGAHAAGVNFYVDHAAGKGDLFLRPKEFDADEAALLADLAGFRPKRPNCFADPAVLARLEKRLEESVKRHAAHEPKGYVLDDELSITRGVNPMDYCFCDACLANLREFVAKRYRDVAKLDAAWGTSFKSWRDVVPPTTEESRRANAQRPLSQLDFTAWSDRLEAMDASFHATIDRLCERSRQLDPKTPVGYTGGEFPSAFGGFQWDEPFDHLSLVEVYEAGVAPELARAALGRSCKVVSTLFVPDDAKARAAWSPFEVLERMGRGDDGAVIWSSGAIFTSSGDDLDEAGTSLAAAVGEASRLRARLASEHAQPLEPTAAPVLLFENAPSVRAAWMVDSWKDGRTWPKRLTSYEAAHSSSATSREGWASVLRAAAVPYGFAWPRDLDAKKLGARGVRTVVLHEALALSDREVAALEEFVRGGGLLVGDTHALLFDERLHGRDSAALARLFGVRRSGDPKLDALAEGFDADAEHGEVGALEPASDTRHGELGFERRLGGGTTLYLERRLTGPPGNEQRRAARLELAPRLREWLARHGVKESPRLPLDVAGRLRLQRWRTTGAANAAEEWALVVATAPARAPVDSSVEFDGDADVEWIEPPRPKSERVVAGRPLAVRVDDSHAVLLRWRPVAR